MRLNIVGWSDGRIVGSSIGQFPSDRPQTVRRSDARTVPAGRWIGYNSVCFFIACLYWRRFKFRKRPRPRLPHTGTVGVPPTATAVRVTSAPKIDGNLDDAGVDHGSRATAGFRRDVPSDGKPATEDSEIRVVYDDHAMYVGARLFNRDKARVSRRLSRRDSFSVFNDVFFVMIDSYHDHTTGFIFGATPAGERRDAIQSGDGRFIDGSWDPVWEVKTTVDSLGWVAEMRIPFSQLRFPNTTGSHVGRPVPPRHPRGRRSRGLVPGRRAPRREPPRSGVTSSASAASRSRSASRCCPTPWARPRTRTTSAR